MNPWQQVANSYGSELQNGTNQMVAGYQQQAQAPATVYDRFINGYMQAKQMKMKEMEMARQQMNTDRQMMLAEETMRHNRAAEEQRLKTEQDRVLKDARADVMKQYEGFNARIAGSKERLQASLKAVGLGDIPLPSVSGVDTNVELPGPVQPGQRLMLQTEDRLSGLGPAAYDSEQKQMETERRNAAAEAIRIQQLNEATRKADEDRETRKELAKQGNDTKMLVAGMVGGLRRDQYEDKKSEKKKEEYNKDYGSLVGSFDSLDRLATQAQKVLSSKGLSGVTGLRGKIPDVPGSDAANARAELESLKSQVGFAVLQNMRNNSKTGGALGSVSDAEGKRLEAALGALATSQDEASLRKNLQNIMDYTATSKDNLTKVFKVKHGGGEDSITDAAGRREPPNRTDAERLLDKAKGVKGGGEDTVVKDGKTYYKWKSDGNYHTKREGQ